MKVSTSKQFEFFIGGKFVQPESYFDSLNPSTGESWAKIPDASLADVQEIIASAKRAYVDSAWRKMTVSQRGIYLKKIAQVIRKNAKELAQIESTDTGKTSKQTTFIDVPTCAGTFEYFSHVENWLADRANPVDAPVKSITKREPAGVIACILPWNYPLVMAAWKIAPALIAGNAVILKPSPLASASILKLAQLIRDVGLPKGIFQVVTTNNKGAALELVKNDDVDMVSFSGGTETGKTILKESAGTLKKSVMELGGKSASIVLEDCNQEAALGGVMSSIFMNQGQMCTACSRLLLHENIYDEFLDRLVKKTKSLHIGPADEATTDFGPVISQEHRDAILAVIEKAEAEGAEVLCGAKALEQNGFYIEPTILANVSNDKEVAQQEIFGPVLIVIKVKDQAEAIKIANDSPYGLAASVWSQNINLAKETADQLEVGTVWINTYGGFYDGASFGGYKKSGFGRELGLEGLLEFTRSKNICVDQTPGGQPLVAAWF